MSVESKFWRRRHWLLRMEVRGDPGCKNLSKMIVGNRGQRAMELDIKRKELEIMGKTEEARLAYLEYLKHLGGSGVEGVVPKFPVVGKIYSHTLVTDKKFIPEWDGAPLMLGLVRVLSDPFGGRLITARLIDMPTDKNNLIGLEVASTSRKWFEIPSPDTDRGMIVYGFVFAPRE